MLSLKGRTTELLTYGLPLFVILSSITIALSPLLKQYPELAMAITFDLTLTAPLLFLLLSIKSKKSKLQAIPFFIIGIVITSFLIPENDQIYLNYIKNYALPLVELLVIGFLFQKIRSAAKVFSLHTTDTSDFLTLSKTSAQEVFGISKISSFMASEISMMYYAFFSWKKKKRTSNEFTNYNENASIAMTLALLFVVFIETFTFHILLMKWSSIAAWGLTLTSIYSAILLFGHLKALLHRPSIVTTKKLTLKNGLIADITIKLEDINTIALCTSEITSKELKVGNLGLSKESTNHNIAIYFNKSQRIEKIYGFSETCDILLIHIDNKHAFINCINEYVEHN